MGLTRFPNGLTVNSTTALQYNSNAGDGDLDCNRLFTAGAASVGGALTVGGNLNLGTAGNVLIGQVVAIPVIFQSGSAAQTLPVMVPFAGNIVSAYVTMGSVSALVSQYTVQVGSAGAVSVASVTNTVSTAFASELLTTTIAAVTTANGIKVIRAAQGTAGETCLTLLVQRTG